MKKKRFVVAGLFFFALSSFLFAQTITITNPTASSKWRGVQTIEWSVEGEEPEDCLWVIKYYDPGISDWWYWNNTSESWQTTLPDPEDRLPKGTRSLDVNTLDPTFSSTTFSGAQIEIIAGNSDDFSAYGTKDSEQFLIDNTPPTINISYNPATPDGNNGWYITAPEVTITITDGDAGVRKKPSKFIEYQIDNGSIFSCFSDDSYNETSITFTATEGSTLKVWAYDDAEDKDGTANEGYEESSDYKVDLTDPSITINVDYGAKTFTLDVTDATSGVGDIAYSFDGGDTWTPYPGTSVSIPEGTSTLMVRALDNAGNTGEATQTFTSNRKISGYVKNYKGTALANVQVLLGGDENNTATTNTSGYYEFTGLNPFGDYFVAPLLKNNTPAARIYDGLETDKTDQNFVLVGGWLRGGYDRGATRGYQFASTSTIEPMVISERYSISLTGTNVLTGVLNTTDNKMDITFTNGTYLRGYYLSGSSYIKRSWSPKLTSYNLTLLDSTSEETILDSMLLCGTGQYVAEIYNKDGTKTKEITRPGAPSGIQWSAIGAGGGNIIFTGFDDDTESDTILFYSILNDGTLWETSLNQHIIPGTEVICLREAGKPALLIGSESDDADLKLVAIDLETGHSLWTKTFSGVKGKITPLVAPVEEGGWDDVIAVRTSTNDSQGATHVYVLDGATGTQKMNWIATSTPAANTTFSAAVSDINNDGNNELVISDGSGNIYVVNLSTGTTITSAEGAGKVWATVDFDGKADGKKEIIVSSGTEIRILSSDLTLLASRDMEDNILNVVLGETVGDGRIDIIVTLPSKTSIVRAAASVDLPGTPVIADIYSSDGKVYLVWTYTPTTADLSGFRIYRSSNPSEPTSWKLIGTVTADVNSYVDSPSEGIYSYKVAAYNDFGETLSSASEPVEVVSGEASSSPASCFIATAAFGTPMAKEVVRLREFRDRYLVKSRAGCAFVRWYYRHSPSLAEYIRQRRWARVLVRGALRPLLWIVSFVVH